jgi:uncharacterized membrane protein YsdA (DUF1294 family)
MGGDVWVVVGVYLLANLAALVAFFFDKKAAVKRSRRVPERTLLTVAAFGPFGALLVMRTLRHKTRKNRFLLVYLFALLHIMVITYMVVSHLGATWPST